MIFCLRLSVKSLPLLYDFYRFFRCLCCLIFDSLLMKDCQTWMGDISIDAILEDVIFFPYGVFALLLLFLSYTGLALNFESDNKF